MEIGLCCCQTAGSVDTLAHRMIIFNWYDGPTGGVLICGGCNKAFTFMMIDWDPEHEVRIFSLAPLAPGSVERIIAFFGQAPEWPIWFPAKLRSPTEKFRSQLGILNRDILPVSPPTMIIAWHRTKQKIMAARPTEPKVLGQIKDWFDADRIVDFDWFSYLGLTK